MIYRQHVLRIFIGYFIAYFYFSEVFSTSLDMNPINSAMLYKNDSAKLLQYSGRFVMSF